MQNRRKISFSEPLKYERDELNNDQEAVGTNICSHIKDARGRQRLAELKFVSMKKLRTKAEIHKL